MTQLASVLSNPEEQLGLVASKDFAPFQITAGMKLSTFLVNYLERKVERTGWNGGRLEMITTHKRRPQGVTEGEGEKLEKPFPSMLDALIAGGFVANFGDAIDKIRLLGLLLKGACPVAYKEQTVERRQPREGQPAKYTTLQVWLKTTRRAPVEGQAAPEW